MVFPRQNLPLPHRPFPFNLSAQVLPKEWVPDCHLVRTVIPCLPISDSLGVFHHKTNRSLASFARMISRGNIGNRFGHKRSAACSSFPTYSLKAGYTARSTRFCAPPCRFIPVRMRSGFLYRSSQLRHTIPGLRGNRVVCSMPLERARDP